VQMSADNGIYITQWNDGYRVVHAAAIENIDFFKIGSDQWKATQVGYFGRSPVYKTKQEAIVEAHRREKDILSDEYCPILEYGVCTIPGNRGDFPTMTYEEAQEVNRAFWAMTREE